MVLNNQKTMSTSPRHLTELLPADGVRRMAAGCTEPSPPSSRSNAYPQVKARTRSTSHAQRPSETWLVLPAMSAKSIHCLVGTNRRLSLTTHSLLHLMTARCVPSRAGCPSYSLVKSGMESWRRTSTRLSETLSHHTVPKIRAKSICRVRDLPSPLAILLLHLLADLAWRWRRSLFCL